MKLFRHSNKARIATALIASCLTSATFASEDTQHVQAKETIRDMSRAFAKVASQCTPAVVFIKTEYRSVEQEELLRPDFFQDEFFQRFFGLPPRRMQEERPPLVQMAHGSGFLVSEDGYILTNNHVVQKADKITVVLNDGREFEGKLVGADQSTDLAVIKVEEKSLPFISLGDSEDLDIGDWVIAIGNPFGFQASLTVGVVSAKGRSLGFENIADFIQTDAAINQGNSGGPLINLNGEVIGINTAIATTTGGYVGLGFAIPSNLAKMITDKLISNGSFEHGFLGITMQPLQGNLAEYYKEIAKLESNKGVVIKDVVKGSPAEKAGLNEGDVITHIDGKIIESVISVRKHIQLLEPGTIVKLTVNRKGKVLPIEVKLGSITKGTSGKVAENLGLRVIELTDELAAKLGYGSEKGVIIEKIDPNSAAGKEKGLHRGALITEINNKKISSVKEFNDALEKAKKSGRFVRLSVKGQHGTFFVALPFE